MNTMPIQMTAGRRFPPPQKKRPNDSACVIALASVKGGPGKSTIAHCLKFPVPSGDGQPDFNLDVRVT